MASIEKVIGGFGDEVQIFITYDNNLMLLESLRCVNNGEYDMYGEATQVSNGRTYSKLFLAHTDTNIAIPTARATRLELFLDSIGRIDGVEYHFKYPYP